MISHGINNIDVHTLYYFHKVRFTFDTYIYMHTNAVHPADKLLKLANIYLCF